MTGDRRGSVMKGKAPEALSVVVNASYAVDNDYDYDDDDDDGDGVDDDDDDDDENLFLYAVTAYHAPCRSRCSGFLFDPGVDDCHHY